MAAPGPEDGSGTGAGTEREWPRVLALSLAMVLVAAPMSFLGIPFLLLLVALPVQRRSALLVGALVAVLVLGAPLDSGLWYLERGWAVLAGGWFVALTMRWPAASLLHRSLASVGAAATVTAAAFLARPSWWGVVDWRVKERFTDAAGQWVLMASQMQGEETLSAEYADLVYRTAELQATLFPAVLGLSTLAGLALSWWLYNRLAAGRKGVLAAFRELRFEDQLVWVFIAGLLMVAVTAGEGWTRAGSNTLVFMGTLYVLRGAAVVLFLNGGLSFIGALILGVAMLLMAPVILGAALLIGLGDTWLDVRARARALAG